MKKKIRNRQAGEDQTDSQQTKLYLFHEKPAEYTIAADFVMHSFLKENQIIAKQYQLDIAKNCIHENTAVILPTGLGKTIIAFLVIAELLPRKILFLAPTKPLVMQHYESCKKFLNIDDSKIVMLSGSIPAKKRKDIFIEATVIISTPQTIKNDLEKKQYKLNDFGLVIFDELHKAVEEYAYVEIAKQYKGLILGLTASPGAKKKKIQKIFENLKIKNIESRIRDDSDVKEYIKDINIAWEKTPLDEELKKIRAPVQSIFLEKLEKLNRVGILTYKKPQYLTKKDILGARMAIIKRFSRTPYAFHIHNSHSVVLQAYHCLELLDTQGAEPFIKYLEKFKEKKKLSKSEQMFINHESLQKARMLAERKKGLSHPKLALLKGMVEAQFQEEQDSLILIFTQFRDTIDSIEAILQNIPGTKIHRFIGQAKRGKEKGMNQKEQKEIIDKFKNRETNILIATSVAEEGIDIPNVNLVIFYEPIPSEIRGIQRKGRTGRSHLGKVIILIAEGTKDEAYFHVERYKEGKMQDIIGKMKKG
ncbi:MAG: helicase-related protein [Nanoarchaeota archaeon]